jgi:GxxExxY protein
LPVTIFLPTLLLFHRTIVYQYSQPCGTIYASPLNEKIGTRRVDFLASKAVSVELKTLTKLEDVHFAQAINYLEAYNLEIGLLINFGETSLNFKRLSNKKYKP